MSDPTRRRHYRYDRIMIESARILDPQFSDAVVYLTGAQIELLRNVTEYLRRLETYTVEYHLGYYLTPTAEDYDDLMAIVADLEETLMGNPNTIWGYKDRWALWKGETKDGDGAYYQTTGQIPEGYVYVLQNVNVRNRTTAVGQVQISVHDGAETYDLKLVYSVAQGIPTMWQGSVPLKEGDMAYVYIDGCLNGDVIDVGYLGYKMVVPE